jgi:hypothetical protein
MARQFAVVGGESPESHPKSVWLAFATQLTPYWTVAMVINFGGSGVGAGGIGGGGGGGTTESDRLKWTFIANTSSSSPFIPAAPPHKKSRLVKISADRLDEGRILCAHAGLLTWSKPTVCKTIVCDQQSDVASVCRLCDRTKSCIACCLTSTVL